MSYPELVVMLTQNDKTVENAAEIFEQCKHAPATYWGFKEIGLSEEEMKQLFSGMKSCGKSTVLEVVAYDEASGLRGAKLAADCGCDILMGTCFYDSILKECQKNSIVYMPFLGRVEGRPSVLKGTAEEMVREAAEYTEKGVCGFDLLGYRHEDGSALCKNIVSQVDARVCIAGSIASFERLQEVKEINPWGFTIGGAFFKNAFGKSWEEQIYKVCEYMKK